MSHSLTFKRSWLSFDSISSTVGALMERVVSSANNLALISSLETSGQVVNTGETKTAQGWIPVELHT